MRGVTYERWGPPEVIRIGEFPEPEPRANDVLVEVHAATVTQGDCEIRGKNVPKPFGTPIRMVIGWNRPKRPPIAGAEFAGVVVGIGSKVTRFAIGDRVAGGTDLGMGAQADYLRLPETGGLVKLQPETDFHLVAGLAVGGLNGLAAVKAGAIQKGERVIVVGGGGVIGTWCVALAKHAGAHVTAVDRPDKHPILLDCGADAVLDHQKEDWWRRDEAWDVVLEAVGASPFGPSLKRLNPGGRLILTNPRPSQWFRVLRPFRGQGKKAKVVLASEKPEELAEVRDLVESGVVVPIIDRVMPLEDIVAAHRRVEGYDKTGCLVLDVAVGRTTAAVTDEAA